MTLTFGELFAGIAGFGLGFHRAGLVCKWQVEIDDAARGVLARHYPDVERHADVRDVGAHNLAPVDVITFGSPCQDLSVAGRRQGLDGARSGLFFEAVRIIRELRPRYAIWENVPGALSSNGGRDFGAALDALADAGALDLCWRVLDAQWFGVAQRRRRVFLVASFGAGASAAEILFEPESGSRNPPPRRKAGEGVTRGAAAGVGGRRAIPEVSVSLTAKDQSRPESGAVTLIPDWPAEVAPTLGTGWADRHPGTQNQDWIAQKGGLFVPDVYTIKGAAIGRAPENGPQYGEVLSDETCYTLNCTEVHAVAFTQNQRDEVRDLGDCAGALAAEPGAHQQNYIAFTNRGIEQEGPHETLRAASHGALPMVAFSLGSHSGAADAEVSNKSHATGGPSGMGIQAELSHTLKSGRTQAVAAHMAVRRLTPTECERLQGFPDGWTAEQSDSARYRQLGNAVAVPCAEWIGRRLVVAL